ncbi:hypothetical protein PROVALCAL_00696 [Providencia alcalifaciens DSM 30120]|uniref:Uncharacterized protein n=1 Tax=Providencia alcalifaciens DSM 30120 TaxID=520999 RepID=B6XBI6_9GAMM|nr:hypothetical protein PROVALCAL_00696 [Providencia alcalifaciens DSM 30120]
MLILFLVHQNNHPLQLLEIITKNLMKKIQHLYIYEKVLFSLKKEILKIFNQLKI